MGIVTHCSWTNSILRLNIHQHLIPMTLQRMRTRSPRSSAAVTATMLKSSKSIEVSALVSFDSSIRRSKVGPTCLRLTFFLCYLRKTKLHSAKSLGIWMSDNQNISTYEDVNRDIITTYKVSQPTVLVATSMSRMIRVEKRV